MINYGSGLKSTKAGPFGSLNGVLPHEAMHIAWVFAVVRCPSVRLSVCHVVSKRLNLYTIKLFHHLVAPSF